MSKDIQTIKKCGFRRGCDNDANETKTKSGRPSKLCQYHYDQQRRWDVKRAKTESRIKYCEKRKKNPKRIAWKKQYEKKRRKDPKRRLAVNNSVLKWRKNNPVKAQKVYEKTKKSIKRRVYNLKYSAPKRDISMKLTDDEIAEILSKKYCYYCGKYDDMVGIDRIDSNKGYETGNVVPCCKLCNFMKGKYDIDVFIKICKHISSHQGRLQNEEFYPECFDDVTTVRYEGYIKGAEARKITFELSKEKFDEIRKSECYLCGKENSNKHDNGIDRVKNDHGYIEGNMKSCCKTCNFMKNKWELLTFLDHCFRIATNSKFAK